MRSYQAKILDDDARRESAVALQPRGITNDSIAPNRTRVAQGRSSADVWVFAY